MHEGYRYWALLMLATSAWVTAASESAKSVEKIRVMEILLEPVGRKSWQKTQNNQVLIGQLARRHHDKRH